MRRKEIGCTWCDKPVQRKGDTCDWTCYASWIAWRLFLSEDRGLLELQPQDEMVNDMTEQPWYEMTMKGEG